MRARIMLGIIVLMALSWMSLSDANAQTCPSGMVSYWKLDEGEGDTAYDFVSTNHGTIHGATWTTGIVSGALSFDGTDDYVQLPDVFPSGGNPRTIMAWFKARDPSAITGIIGWGVDSYARSSYLAVREGVLYFFGHGLDLMCYTTIQPDTWYHGAFTYENGIVTLYLNGEFERSHPRSLNTGQANSAIGRCWGPAYSFDGTIDEVAVYNRALTEEEIQQHYQNGLNGSGYCEEASLTVTIDIRPAINPDSKGVIPVAILTTDDFDATTVDPLSVKFGPGEATETHETGHIEDVDDDGDDDLVLHFKTQDTGIKADDTEACLTGETGDGQAIEGCDAIVTKGKSKKAPALRAAGKLTTTWASIRSKH